LNYEENDDDIRELAAILGAILNDPESFRRILKTDHLGCPKPSRKSTDTDISRFNPVSAGLIETYGVSLVF